MTKAITIEKLRIHCDICHHEFEGTPPDWHNKECPRCGRGVLINDEDMAAWNAIVGIIETTNEVCGELPDEGRGIKFTFDTSGLRPNA